MPLSPFLRRILLLDAASCLALGVLLALGFRQLAELFGLAPALVGGAAIALLPVGIFILWLAGRKAVHPALIWMVIAGNAAWVVESLIVAGRTEAISSVGTAFVIAQAAFVAAMALLEWIGLNRSRAEAAA